MIDFLYPTLIRIHVLKGYHKLRVSRKDLSQLPLPSLALDIHLGIAQRPMVSMSSPAVVNPRPLWQWLPSGKL